jgi:hypothetical protein
VNCFDAFSNVPVFTLDPGQAAGVIGKSYKKVENGQKISFI